MDVETILRLAEIPRVVGLKEASPNFGKIARLMTVLPEDFVVFSGEDSTALALGLTSGSLAALQAAAVHPSRAAELAVLTVSNLLATVLRFALLRMWVFRGEAR